MEIEFNGAAGIVTGSCHLLTVNNKKYLLDCGLFQGIKETTKRNYLPFPFDPKKIEAVILSHAHIDHSGLIPKLYKNGFRGIIYCTKATKDLCRIMLEDSANIHEREAVYDNKRLAREGKPLRQPLYEKKDAINCMDLFRTVNYDSVFEVSNDIKLVFRDAGHILGSAIVEVFAKENNETKKIVFSGDLGQPGLPIIKDPEMIKEADIVIMESTYGGRIHESVAERREMLLKIIKENHEKGGVLMIPSFAIERAQELIYRLNEFSENNLMPKTKVFVDSPLAIKATEIFLKHPECYDEEIENLLAKDDNPFEFPELKYVTNVNDSKKLNEMKGPFIVIAGSGMCNGGRIKHHLKNHLDEEKSTLLFIGYQAIGTLGRSLRDGTKKVKIYGRWYPVNVNIDTIGGFSAHADKPALVKWAKNFKGTPQIIIVHGEPKESEELASEIRKFNKNIRIPKMRDVYKLN